MHNLSPRYNEKSNKFRRVAYAMGPAHSHADPRSLLGTEQSICKVSTDHVINALRVCSHLLLFTHPLHVQGSL